MESFWARVQVELLNRSRWRTGPRHSAVTCRGHPVLRRHGQRQLVPAGASTVRAGYTRTGSLWMSHYDGQTVTSSSSLAYCELLLPLFD